MKCFSTLVLIFVTFQINAKVNCEKKVQLTYKGKNLFLCHNAEKDTYSSTDGIDLGTSFFTRKVDLTYYKNQSPGFSLCYQLGGDAFFGQIAGLTKKIPMCRKKDFFADQESLLLYYRDNILVK